MSESPWVGAPLASLHIKQSVDIAAPRSTVFDALTDGIGHWWGAPYLATGEDAVDVVVEARPGGMFKDVTADGDGYVWCLVEQVRRARLLTLTGRMGMPGAIAGTVRFELEDADGGTRLNLEHRAVGQLGEDMEKDFSGGWQDLLGARLKTYVERGEVMGIRARA